MSSVIRPNGAAKETTSLPVAGWGEETDDISDYSIYDRPRMVCCPDNWISFENDSELTYDIIWQTLALHLRLRCLVSHNWSANTSVNASRRKWHFFVFLASALGWPLGFLIPFHTQPKKILGTGLIHTCCVELRYGCCIVFAFTQGPGSTQKTKTPEIHGTLSTRYFCSVICSSFHEISEE